MAFDWFIDLNTLPRITLVTPSYNQAAWLERTLQSVLGQGYPNLEYGVVDGGSTDGSLEILERYRDKLSFCIVEPDKGMYDAIQKGFARSTGEIMGYLNSDDVLMPGALLTLARLFTDIGQAEWITGYRCAVDELGCAVALEPPKAWSAEAFVLDHKWIQQESTYWRRSLWERAGATMRTDLKLAGDYELWYRFFRHAPLYSTDALIGGFRVRSKNQASLEQLEAYEAEAAELRNESPPSLVVMARVAKIRRHEALISKLKGIGKDALRRRLIKPLFSEVPRIRFDRRTQRFILPI